jgi:uncharacterized 2Fe-2S/4Fe-4S cluster protein (DUF4445 family)
LAQRIITLVGDNEPHKSLCPRQGFAVAGNSQENGTRRDARFVLLNARAKVIGADHVGMMPSNDTIRSEQIIQVHDLKAKRARSAVACADNIAMSYTLLG